MNILSFNPGHDGAVAYLQDGRLVSLVEVEKDSNYRHSGLAVHDFLKIANSVRETPDVLCEGGWWSHESNSRRKPTRAGYRGVSPSEIIVGEKRLLGKNYKYFSSSHERSHLQSAFAMSPFPKGTPCYALIWEGSIGTFYECDTRLNWTTLADVVREPGHRYALLYGLADLSYAKNLEYSRISDAGKLMALVSFSQREPLSSEEAEVMTFLLQECEHLAAIPAYDKLKHSCFFNVGLDDLRFRNFAGIFSDEIFDRFYRFAESHMKKGLPLLISGGCGLNCDWNSRWRVSGLFSEVFVPPVANDSGSAIGTAVDAQYYFTGNPKLAWDVYSGSEFDVSECCDLTPFDVFEADESLIADMLAHSMILGWANGKYEIGPRALGNRSILAAPFEASTRVRLNHIKQREQFRPIAPVCLEEETSRWFDCHRPSPYMLYTYRVNTDALAAVTHVDRTARLQTVSRSTNERLYKVLVAFKAITGYGVLCNTSLNFNGCGFINRLRDLAEYTCKHELDGFVVEGRAYMRKESENYRKYLATCNATEHRRPFCSKAL